MSKSAGKTTRKKDLVWEEKNQNKRDASVKNMLRNFDYENLENNTTTTKIAYKKLHR